MNGAAFISCVAFVSFPVVWQALCAPFASEGQLLRVHPARAQREAISRNHIIFWQRQGQCWGRGVFVWGQRGKWLPRLLHYGSDPYQPELVQGPQVKGTAPNKSAQTSDASCKCRSPHATHKSHGCWFWQGQSPFSDCLRACHKSPQYQFPCLLRGPLWTTKILLSLGRFKSLEAPSQELKTKTRQILYYAAVTPNLLFTIPMYIFGFTGGWIFLMCEKMSW